MKNRIKYLAFGLLTTIILNAGIASAESTPFKLEAFGMDTIAGFEAQIYSSKTFANKNVVFTIVKPSGTELNIPVLSNDEGIAEFNLYDYHTKEAGEYKVAAHLDNGTNGNFNTFTVFPDSISSENSTIDPSKLVAKATGTDKIYVTITLRDKYDNPIKGHEIAVISSRANDQVLKVSQKAFTDESGSMIFTLSSTSDGVSIYSFLDSTANKVLDKRVEIAYTGMENAGGSIETAYAQAGEVSNLVFENLPATILPNSDTPFTLTAYDSEGGIVPNYSGSVHFSVEGSNSVYASLPNDYTFDVDFDSGSHEFKGAGSSLNFAQAGTYTVVATDLGDFTIRGTEEIFVGTGSQPPQTTTGNDFELVIDSPTAGTYGQREFTITGTAPSTDLTIQLFDNDVTLGSTEVQGDRTFSFQTDELLDGPHTLIAVALDSDDTIQYTSDEVKIDIDTSPPEVKNIKITPSTGIKTGDILDIVVTSEPDVFQGAVVFNVDIAELEQDPNDPTKYNASIQAPTDPGTYPLDVILVDELGNEGSYTNVAILEITEGGDGLIDGQQPVAQEDQIPSDVFGVQVVSTDAKVTLKWQPASDDSGIDHYKIYFGLTPSNLDRAVNTFDNKTTWYIPNLVNGQEYFFAVAAVDDADQESANKSSIVSGIPYSQVQVFTPPPDESQVKTVTITTNKLESTGPEMIWFVLISLLISQLYFKFKKKVC